VKAAFSHALFAFSAEANVVVLEFSL